MHIKNALLNITEFDRSIFGYLTQAAENYLYVGQKAYYIKEIREHRNLIHTIDTPSSLPLTILKVISYSIIIFPLLALSIKYLYRRTHEWENLSWKKDLTEDFIKSFEKNIGPFSDDRLLFRIFTQAPAAERIEFTRLEQELDSYLINPSVFNKSQEKLVEITYIASQQILNSLPSPEQLAFAKAVYKKIACFLRSHSNKEQIYSLRGNVTMVAAYRNYVEGRNECGGYPYLDCNRNLISSDEEYNNQFVLNHVFKKLRKQIKLVDKQQTIRARIQNNPHLQDISPELIEKALPYLSLTWLHGTKLSTLASACRMQGEILPLGELRKRNIQISTGALDAGARGINLNYISGVNLGRASVSIDYSQRNAFDLEETIRKYEELLNKEFNTPNEIIYGNYNGELGQLVESLRRIQRFQPHLFQRDKEALIQKVDCFYQALKTHVFSSPGRISRDYDKNQFYSFVKELEEMEKLVHAPLNPEQDLTETIQAAAGIVIGSKTKYGIPKGLEQPGAEEDHFGKMHLGTDIQVIFTKEENLDQVRAVIQEGGLRDQVQVESLSVLETANKIEKALGGYFYDTYNLRKWELI